MSAYRVWKRRDKHKDCKRGARSLWVSTWEKVVTWN